MEWIKWTRVWRQSPWRPRGASLYCPGVPGGTEGSWRSRERPGASLCCPGVPGQTEAARGLERDRGLLSRLGRLWHSCRRKARYVRTSYLALGSGRSGWRDPKAEGRTPSSAVWEVGPWLGRVWPRRWSSRGPTRHEPGPSPQAPCWAPDVRTAQRGAGVSKGFYWTIAPGQSSQAPAREKTGVCNLRGGGATPIYPGGYGSGGTKVLIGPLGPSRPSVCLAKGC